MEDNLKVFLKLKNLDRKWVYLVVALAVIIPILKPSWFNFLSITPSKPVQSLYDFVNTLPAGTRCYLSFDFDPAAEPELGPGAVAMLTHMFTRGLKPICAANWPAGGDLANAALEKARINYEANFEEWLKNGKLVQSCGPKLEKGIDYVNLGYKTGGIIHVKNLCNNFMQPYPTDKDGASTSNMPIFKNNVNGAFSMQDLGLIVSFSAGTNGLEAYISMAGEHKRPMATGCTSVNIPRYTTFIQSGQIKGMIGGLPGAAEYETLIDVKADGTAGMAPQTVAHLAIMIFIILGNLVYLAEKEQLERKR